MRIQKLNPSSYGVTEMNKFKVFIRYFFLAFAICAIIVILYSFGYFYAKAKIANW